MMNPKSPRLASSWMAPVACALAGAAVFQFYGNVNRGYIDTASLFYWWGFQWSNPGSETEHGWLVLGLAVWVLWRNLKDQRHGSRDQGPQLQGPGALAGGHWAAGAAMVAGLGIHAIGFVAQQARVSIVGLLFFAWGVIRLGGGRRWGVAAVFPLGFMLFAIPLNALDTVGLWLRMWVVDASGAIARGCGIAVLQSGTQLVSPDGKYHYDVAEACSGIRSLTAMLALSLLAGYLNFRSWWRRAAVLLLCFPLVYIGNVARIVSIIVSAEAGGPKWGDIAHDVMGYGIFGIVLGGVLLAIAGLRRWLPEGDGNVDTAIPSDMRTKDERATRPYIVASMVVILAAGEMAWLARIAARPGQGVAGVMLAPDGLNPVELPSFLGIEWTGRPAEVSQAERAILPPDTGYSRKVYFNHRNTTRQVFLSIVLSGRDRTSIHRPELCLMGQGWTVDATAQRAFNYPGGAPFSATVLLVQREVQTPQGKQRVPQLVAYWFVGGDSVVPSHWGRMARDAWNRVFHGRADRWAYVLMQTDATDGEAAALTRMQAVLDEALPAFQPRGL